MYKISKQTIYQSIFYVSLAAILAVVLSGWWAGSLVNISSSAERFIAVGRLLGLIAGFSILLEVVLVSRLPLIEKYFDLDEYNDLHRLNGYLVLLATIGHLVFILVGYSSTYSTSLVEQFWQFNTSFDYVLWATIGTVLFFSLVLVSVRAARRKIPYQIWYLIHLLIYAAIFLTFFHQVNSGSDFIAQSWFRYFWYTLYGITLLLLLTYRFIRPLSSFWRHNFKIQKIVVEAEGTYSIYISGKNIERFKFLAGQYGSFWFLSKSTFYESHPYSFSNPPGSKYIRVTIKTNGDFGKKVIGLPKGTPVIIDGPRGSFITDRSKSDSVVLVAGGIGVAPYMSTIPTLLETKKSVCLYYAVHSPGCLAFKDELDFYKKYGLSVREFVSTSGHRIDEQALGQCVNTSNDVYVCGPGKMSQEFSDYLVKKGLPKGNLICERFTI